MGIGSSCHDQNLQRPVEASACWKSHPACKPPNRLLCLARKSVDSSDLELLRECTEKLQASPCCLQVAKSLSRLCQSCTRSCHCWPKSLTGSEKMPQHSSLAGASAMAVFCELDEEPGSMKACPVFGMADIGNAWVVVSLCSVSHAPTPMRLFPCSSAIRRQVVLLRSIHLLSLLLRCRLCESSLLLWRSRSQPTNVDCVERGRGGKCSAAKNQ